MNDSETATMLVTKGLCKNFGALEVARDVNFRLDRGARHALIGPNGAGKTTFINLLTGVLAPSRGSVLLEGEDVTSLAQSRRVKRGIARTFQINQLFRGLTVQENVGIAVSERLGVGGSMKIDMPRPGRKKRPPATKPMILFRLVAPSSALRPLRDPMSEPSMPFGFVIAWFAS